MAAIAESRHSEKRIETRILDDLKDMGTNLTAISDEFAQLCKTRALEVRFFHETRESEIARLVEGSNIPSVRSILQHF
jgi:hypothetical protein